ncbi:unnamed protein product [Orchesella dallaii]|uniref:Gustatory receptor n=1 Tax=Orchesella dallaii TaxID=48710 RepID=A0ABP1RND6_9HEXA
MTLQKIKELFRRFPSSISKIYKLKPALLSPSVIEGHVRFHIALSEITSYVPISWDPTTERVTVKNNKSKIRNHPFTLISFVVVLLALIQNTIMLCHSKYKTPNEEEIHYKLLFRGVFFTIQSAGIVIFILMENHGNLLASLLNEMITISKSVKTKPGTKLALRLVSCSALITPVATAAMVMYLDIAPSFSGLTSYIVSRWIDFGLQKVFTILLVYNLFAYALTGYITVCSIAITLCALWNEIQELKMMQEQHFKLLVQFEKYRKIQLLSCYVNACFKTTIFLWLTVVAIFMDILSFTVCILGIGSVTLIIVVGFAVISLNLNFTTLVGYKFPGMMNKISKQIIHGWKHQIPKSRGYASKYGRSCSDIRIRFGEVNFVEAKTCLNITDFKMQQMINLMLLNQ